MKKRFTSILVAIMMILPIIPVSVYADFDTSGVCGDNATWSFYANTITISGTGEMYDYEFDKGSPWDGAAEYINAVVIEEGITKVGKRAFIACNSLTEVQLAESVEVIGESAFPAGIEKINFSENLKIIGAGALEGLGFEGRLELPDSIVEIGDTAFASCYELTEIILPEGITELKDRTFSGCSSLETIVVPETVRELGESVFGNCTSLKSITLPEGLKSIGTRAFEGCEGLEEITIPASVEKIASDAFNYCTSLKSIYFSNTDSLFNIERGSLNGLLLNGTTNAYINGEIPTRMEIPDTVVSIADNAFFGWIQADEFVIPESVKRIGTDAFVGSGCYDDEVNWTGDVLYVDNALVEAKTTISGNYNILEGTSVIADYAFEGCEALESITAPENVENIPMGAFNCCFGLKAVSLPSTIKTIGELSFESCTALEGIVIPFGVEEIKASAFHHCVAMATAEIPDTVKYIRDYAFQACNALNNVILPDGLKAIGSGAFQSCTSLESIRIPDGIDRINDYAFRACISLEDIYLPEGITYIGYESFWMCESLTSIDIPDTVTDISAYAFQKCKGIREIDIPDGVERLYADTFAECTGLRTVKLPRNLKYSEFDAFRDSYNISEVYVDSLQSWLDIEFGSLTGNPMQYLPTLYINGKIPVSVTVPKNVTELDRYTFYGWKDTEEFVLHNNITRIGTGAFNKSGYYNNSNNWIDDVLYVGNYLIEAKNTLSGHYNVREGTKIVGNRAFIKNNNLTGITVPDGCVTIGGLAFYRCKGLTEINLPDSINIIEEQAFSESAYEEDENNWTYIEAYRDEIGIHNNSHLYIGKHLISMGVSGYKHLEKGDCVVREGTLTIGDGAFSGCSNLTSITIPDGVRAIPRNCFKGCASLTQLNLPDTLVNNMTSIADGAFEGCSLLNIEIPDTITSIGDEAFANCNSFNFAIPDTVKSIGDNAFSYSKGLQSFTYPKGIKEIPIGAFEACDFKSVTIPEGVTTINSNAFNYCSNLESISLPSTLRRIGAAFGSNESLECVTIPEGVTEMYNSFNYCTSLKEVYLPKSLKIMSGYDFDRCYSLTDIYYGGTEEEWIELTDGLVLFNNPTIHYNSSSLPPKTYPPVPMQTAVVTRNDTDTEYGFDVLLERKYEDCSVYAAVYDGEGNLIGTKQTDLHISGSTPISIEKQANASYVKIFVWTNGVQPIAHQEIIEL